ncbi:MAG TPA: MopE-related protein, partial [Chitinophagaceae bacterium]|nr:MopE-related protein [Chitinophagaceae bacterium]
MNVQYAFYSGSCGNLTQLSCSQLTASYTLNNAALAGQTLYLRIWNYNSLEGGSFQFCLFDPSCLVQIDSIHTTPVACTLVPDGTLTVYASCTLCAGSIQYALNNGAWQNSNVFTNLPSGGYLVKARDGGKTTCFQEWSSLVIVPATQVAHAYYEDLDGDGFGKSSVSVITCGSPPPNYVSASSDCNDGNAQIYPGALEIPCNGIDENCNGMTDDVPVEITVKGNCHAITNGDSSPEPADRTDFGLLMPNEGTTQQFSITNTGLSILHVDSIRLNPGYFTFDSVLNNIQLVPFQTYYFNVHFSAPITGIHQSVIHIYNNDCDESHTAFLLQAEVQNVSISTLQLHVLIEGYMIGNTQMTAAMLNEGLNTCSNETDTIEVELHSPVDFSLQASSKTILHTDGSATCRFQNMSGNYYILVKHRNAVSTVSALPVLIQTNGSYDFTLSAASAYENNLK